MNTTPDSRPPVQSSDLSPDSTGESWKAGRSAPTHPAPSASQPFSFFRKCCVVLMWIVGCLVALFIVGSIGSWVDNVLLADWSFEDHQVWIGRFGWAMLILGCVRVVWRWLAAGRRA